MTSDEYRPMPHASSADATKHPLGIGGNSAGKPRLYPGAQAPVESGIRRFQPGIRRTLRLCNPMSKAYSDFSALVAAACFFWNSLARRCQLRRRNVFDVGCDPPVIALRVGALRRDGRRRIGLAGSLSDVAAGCERLLVNRVAVFDVNIEVARPRLPLVVRLRPASTSSCRP